jgi:hypothetical protein
MRRLLLLVGVLALLFWFIRRAARPRVPGGARRGRLRGGAPKSLVCGSCGAEFEPEKSGWTCPHCQR